MFTEVLAPLTDGNPATLPARRAYSINETCELLGISRTGIYRAIKGGRITPIKFGKRVLIPISQINALLGEATNAA